MNDFPHPLRLAVGSHEAGSGKGCAMNCGRAATRRGYCDTHYRFERAHGHLGNLTEDERWAKFVTPGAADECWEWQGWRSLQGYGRFCIDGRQIPASRAAAIRAGMHVVDGMDVCHTCDNPPCVNPAHLYVGTRSRNTQDMADRNRHPAQLRRGEQHWCAKFSDQAIREWVTSYANGESFTSIARRYGAHSSTVSRTVRGIQRKAA